MALKGVFRPRSVKELIEEAIYETERKLLDAASAAEYWNSQQEMLTRRLERLHNHPQLHGEAK